MRLHLIILHILHVSIHLRHQLFELRHHTLLLHGLFLALQLLRRGDTNIMPCDIGRCVTLQACSLLKWRYNLEESPIGSRLVTLLLPKRHLLIGHSRHFVFVDCPTAHQLRFIHLFGFLHSRQIDGLVEHCSVGGWLAPRLITAFTYLLLNCVALSALEELEHGLALAL
jgi:hypothetical protein